MNAQEMKEEALDTKKSEGVVNNLASDGQKENNAVRLESKEDILDRLTVLLENADQTNKQELDSLQQLFHKLMLQDMGVQKESFLKNGGIEDEFKPTPEPLEENLKSLINDIKQRRKEIIEEDEKERLENLNKKLAIIEKLKELLTATDDQNSYNSFKDLQKEWNSIQKVPFSESKKLWNTFHLYEEQFYDMFKLNNEFREYDFKKNLERKVELCEHAEALDNETDIVSAFHQLQNFHEQWREVGPVNKELREELWERFKNASTVINKKHQDYFENLKQEEEDNFTKKQAICEKIEKVDFESLISFNSWRDKTKEILELQDEWKTIGFTPKKVNAEIFERYRKACDVFFDTKASFFKDQKEDIEDSIKEKEELCEKAESLKDSEDWRKTSEEFVKLQSDWKKTKPIYRKQSELLWKRFSEACDFFFERRNKQQEGKHQEELKNLELKKAVIEELKGLVASDKTPQQVNDEVKELTKKWNAIGFVPFKHKDIVYKEYKALLDTHFSKLNEGIAEKKISNFKQAVTEIKEDGNKNSLYKERERLVRTSTRIQNELKTYENNLGFLNLTSKKGNALIAELNNKVEKMKSDIEILEEKIQIIDKSMK